MDPPLEEGYVYGHAPKPPAPPPNIDDMFEAIGVPKGKLGELPHPKEWYDQAKDRQKEREQETDVLSTRKAEMRGSWVEMVLYGLGVWAGRVDDIQTVQGPTLGLAEQRARAAHERPFDTERIATLSVKADRAAEDLARLTAGLEAVAVHMTENEEQIRKKEAEDDAAERVRVEEQDEARRKKKKVERELARQAALLRGEVWEDDEEAIGAGGSTPASARGAAVTFLGDPASSPSPELRCGLARQLPPLMGTMAPNTLVGNVGGLLSPGGGSGGGGCSGDGSGAPNARRAATPGSAA